MTTQPPSKAAELKARGPLSQNQLISRLKSDPRFVPALQGVESWGAIAPMAGLAYSERHSGLAFFSSSSTGTPKRIPFSADDWEQSVRHRADCLAALGLGERHLAAVLLPFGPWFSGDNISDALLRLGARMLRGPVWPSLGRYFAPHRRAGCQRGDHNPFDRLGSLLSRSPAPNRQADHRGRATLSGAAPSPGLVLGAQPQALFEPARPYSVTRRA